MKTLADLKSQLDGVKALLVDVNYDLDNFELNEDLYEQAFKDNIDECTEVVKVCGISFTPSRILEELDPTAFACGLSDYVDSLDKENDEGYKALAEQREDLENEIEELEEQIEELENEE